jgi:hypothetical protein
VLLVTTDGYYNLSAVNAISPRTGRTSATVKPVQVETSDMSCYPAGTGRAVCTTPDGVVEGWNLKKNTLVWSLPTRKRLAPEVSDVEDGLVYGTIGDATGVVLDARTGEDVVTNAGVAPLDVNASGGVYTFVGQALFSPVNEAG